jgi:hypothetical protein
MENGGKDVADIQDLRRCLSTMLKLHAKRSSGLTIIKRPIAEIEKAEALAAADPVARARALIATS